MADQADGSLRFETELDTSGFLKGKREVEASAKDMAQDVERVGSSAEASAQKVAQAFSDSGKQVDQQTKKVEDLHGELSDLGNEKYIIPITRWNDNSKNSDYGGPVTVDDGKNVQYKPLHPADPSLTVQTDPVKESVRTVNELRQGIENLKYEMKSMEKKGKWWGDEDYDKAAVKLEQMQQAAKDYKSELYSPAPNANPFGLDTLAGKVRQAELDLERLTKAGKGLGDADYDRAYQKLARLTAEAKEYKKALANSTITRASLSESLENAVGKMKTFGSTFQKSIKTIDTRMTQALKKIKAQVASIVKTVKNTGAAIGKFLTLGNKMDNSSITMSKAVKSLMKYGLGLRSLYALVGKFRSAVVAGFSNLAQYSESTNASISSVMSSLTRLKNALATAFAPILTVVAPILSTFIDMCSRAATQVGMFFAALAGQSTFTQAKAVQQDYAESLNKTSSSTNSATKAAEKQAKALKKAQKAAEGSIASFDELNVIQHDTADSTDSTSDTAAAGLTPKDMFEEVPIKSKIKNFADRIKDLIKKQDWKGIGKLLANQMNKGLQKVYDVINWKNVGPKITKFCNAFTESFNSLVDSLNWTALGQTIGAGINTLARTFNLLVGPGGIDFENLGRKLSTGLRGMLDEVSWTEFGNAIGNKIMMVWNTLKGFMDDMTTKNSEGLTGWQQLGNSIADTLNGIFDRVSFKNLAHTAATGINGIFSALKEAVDKFSWEDFTNNLKSGISTFLSETSWQENGKALADFVTHLCDTISAVATKENFKQFGEKIGEFLSELPWKTMLVTAGEAIMNGLTGIMEGLSESTAGSVAAALGTALIGTRIVSTVTSAFKTLFGTSIVGGLNAALVGIPLSAFAGFKIGEFLSTNLLDGDKISPEDFVEKYITGYEKGDISGALNEWLKDVTGGVELSSEDLAIYQQWEDAIMNMIKAAQISGQEGFQLLTYMDSLKSEGTSSSIALLAMQNKMDELGVSTKEFSQALKEVDLDSATEKAGEFSAAIGEVETSPLIDKLESLKYAVSKVEFAGMIVKSANAIDQMGGIWENGKQILGEKALAIYAEISNGLSPDENGFYKLASGQMVQYGQAIEDSGGTLKEKAKSTLDDSLKAGIEEQLPEQNQLGGEMGNYFIEGYTGALAGNKQLKTAYEEALKGVDTTAAQEQAKNTGEELGKNTGTGFQKGVSEVSGDVSDSVTNMMEKSVKEPAQKAVDSHSPSKWFAQLATYCGQGFGNNLNNAFSSTFTWFGNFRTRIENSIGSLYNTGYNFLIGMNNGMVAGASVMYNNARNIASTITGIFRSAWKIHSPSRVSGEIMDYYMQGFYNHMQTGADKLLNAFSSFADLVKDVKFEAPKLNIPVTYSPVTTAAYTQQIPIMAQGKSIPSGAVRDYSNDKSRESDIANAIEKVLKTMKNDDGNFGNNNPQYIVLNIDGREFIRWMQTQNEQNLNRGGPGLFPSAL